MICVQAPVSGDQEAQDGQQTVAVTQQDDPEVTEVINLVDAGLTLQSTSSGRTRREPTRFSVSDFLKLPLPRGKGKDKGESKKRKRGGLVSSKSTPINLSVGSSIHIPLKKATPGVGGSGEAGGSAEPQTPETPETPQLDGPRTHEELLIQREVNRMTTAELERAAATVSEVRPDRRAPGVIANVDDDLFSPGDTIQPA